MEALRARHIYLSVLLIAAAACACTRGQASGAGRGEVKVEITDVGVDPASGAHYVMLEDASGEQGLPILIGSNEAQAIMLELHGLKAPRPLTHDLLRSLIEQTGNHVDRVVISDLRDEVYYASIVLDGGTKTIDSRPSDALALAMKVSAPIYVNQKLLTDRSHLGLGLSGRLPQNAFGLGLTVQELTPELAAAFNLKPQEGLLIAWANRQAQAAGVEKGDVVMQIGQRPLRRLADFTREISALTDAPVGVTLLKRDGTRREVMLRPGPASRN